MMEDRGFFSKPQWDALQQYKGETEEKERHVDIQVELLFDPTVDHRLLYPRIMSFLFYAIIMHNFRQPGDCYTVSNSR